MSESSKTQEFYDAVWMFRDLQPDEVCKECQGIGKTAYSSTATWRGGVGGQAITTGVCNKCWGSGSEVRPWRSWKEIDRLRYALSSTQDIIGQLEEDAKNGADWFNAFCEVESWMMERDWVSDGDMDKKSPAQTLINVLGKTEKALAAKDARIASLEAGLKPFAAEAEKWSSEIHFSDLTPALDILGSSCNNCGDDPGYETAAFTIGDLRRARTLLEGKPDLPFGQNCLKCGALITENTCECGEA